jgi:hypothetical protein
VGTCVCGRLRLECRDPKSSIPCLSSASSACVGDGAGIGGEEEEEEEEKKKTDDEPASDDVGVSVLEHVGCRGGAWYLGLCNLSKRRQRLRGDGGKDCG